MIFEGGNFMIMVVAESIVLEQKVEEYKKLSKIMVEESRKEKGNLSYTLYQDVEDFHCFTVIEFWKDQESLDNHKISTHFAAIVPKMNLLRTNSEVHLYKEVKFE